MNRTLLLLTLLLAAVSGDSRPDRRARIDQMTLAEKQQLLAKAERFRQLPVDEQQRLRGLHAAIAADPAADALLATLDRYSEWLTKLPAAERAELNQLSIDKRVERIKQLMKQRQAFESPSMKPLSPEDRDVVRKWIERQVVAAVPPDKRQEFERMADEDRRRMLARLYLQRFQPFDPARRAQPPTMTEFMALREQLSPAARDELARAEMPHHKVGLITSWVLQALGLWVDEQRLRQFFENEVPANERQRLLAMPADEMQRELRRLYMRSLGRDGQPRMDGQPRFDNQPRFENGPRFDGSPRMDGTGRPLGPGPRGEPKGRGAAGKQLPPGA